MATFITDHVKMHNIPDFVSIIGHEIPDVSWDDNVHKLIIRSVKHRKVIATISYHTTLNTIFNVLKFENIIGGINFFFPTQ